MTLENKPRREQHQEPVEQTGVDDVLSVRAKIAAQHKGDLAEHIAESNRIAEEVRRRLRLGPVVKPPENRPTRSGTTG